MFGFTKLEITRVEVMIPAVHRGPRRPTERFCLPQSVSEAHDGKSGLPRPLFTAGEAARAITSLPMLTGCLCVPAWVLTGPAVGASLVRVFQQRARTQLGRPSDPGPTAGHRAG